MRRSLFGGDSYQLNKINTGHKYFDAVEAFSFGRQIWKWRCKDKARTLPKKQRLLQLGCFRSNHWGLPKVCHQLELSNMNTTVFLKYFWLNKRKRKFDKNILVCSFVFPGVSFEKFSVSNFLLFHSILSSIKEGSYFYCYLFWRRIRWTHRSKQRDAVMRAYWELSCSTAWLHGF